jgi:FKBP-type peptidyl-prolyl cis-trans isomerase FkpA
MRRLIFGLLFLLPFFFFGCKKTEPQGSQLTTAQIDSIDHQTILQYIAAHQLSAIAEPNGLYYVPTQVGTGPFPTASSTVTVTYRGYFTNGTVFDQSSAPISFSLSQVIAGWEEGIPLMQAGGRATLLIPSALGYGNQATGSIPANTVLIFDVSLVSFQ